MSLTEDQVRQFREHGYVAVPDFWTPREVEAMRAELARLQGEGLLRNVTTEGDGQTRSETRQNLQLCPMSPHSTLFRAMPFAPRAVEAVRALLGDPVALHLDQVFLKPARHGAGTSWHQDNAYFRIADPLMGTALWTAVHDATLANGTIRVIPDAYATPLEHSRDPMSDHHIRCYPPEERAVPIELPAGGVVFFAYGTPHATGGNETDHDRAGIAMHFHNADHHAESGFPPEQRVVLSGPDATGGLREYGQTIAGTWDAEVSRSLA